MATEQPLSQLLKCSFCQQEVTSLQVLPCDHSVCLACVLTLRVNQKKFRCAVCQKVHPVPNGGFIYLPNSLIAAEVADLHSKDKITRESTAVNVSSAYFTKLRACLQTELEKGDRWMQKAKKIIKDHDLLLKQLPNSLQTAKNAVAAYKELIVRKCDQKLRGLGKRLSDETAELDEGIANLCSYVVLGKSVNKIISKLADRNCSSQHAEEAEKLLKEFEELHTQVSRLHDYLGESVKMEEGDSVRLSYHVAPEDMESFINGDLLHSSVGLLAEVKLQEVENPLLPFLVLDKEWLPRVIFPETNNWQGESFMQIVKSYAKAEIPRVGDKVKVKVSVSNPYLGWKGVRPKSQGVLKAFDFNHSAPNKDVVVTLELTNGKRWKCLYSEIELADAGEPNPGSSCNGNGRSAATNQIAYKPRRALMPSTDLVKNKSTKSPSGISKPPPTDEDRKYFRRKLQKLFDKGSKWARNSKQMISRIDYLKRSIVSSEKSTREAILLYKWKAEERCTHKLEEEVSGMAEIESKTKAYQDMIQSYADSMQSVIQSCSRSLKGLSEGAKVSAMSLTKAQSHVLSLKSLNSEIRRLKFGVCSFEENRSGDCVRLVKYDEKVCNLAEYVRGRLSVGSVGTIICFIKPYNVRVLFPNELLWEGPRKSVQRILTTRSSPFIGDRVRHRNNLFLQVKQQFMGEHAADMNPFGVLRQIHTVPLFGMDNSQLMGVVEFPEEHFSLAIPYSDIELVSGCEFEVGNWVWVRRTIPEPSRGWGDVNGSSVGKVKFVEEIEGEEEITVEFPECTGWVGLSTDLQLVRDVQICDEVQVKLSVLEPRNGWRSVSHEDLGFLFNINASGECQVRFNNNNNWTCHRDEIEPFRYRPESEREEFVKHAPQDELLQFCRNMSAN